MTAATATIISDRAADQVILACTYLNIDGDQANTCALPAGFGDCLVLESMIDIGAIATLRTPNEQQAGARVMLLDPTATAAHDIIGALPFVQTAADRMTAMGGPDQLVLWRAGDLLSVLHPEIDLNVTPTADENVFVRVRRLRQTPPVEFVGPFERGP